MVVRESVSPTQQKHPMRFKAKLGLEHVQLLCNLIAPISRLTSSGSASADNSGSGSGLLVGSSIRTGGGSVMYLDPDQVRISARGGSGTGASGSDGDGISCFSELATKGGIFLEHRIESAADNVIVFEIDLAQLKLALQSVLSGGGSGSKRSAIQALHNSSIDGNADGVMGSLSAPSAIVMKLAKRNGGLPCLCLDASCAGGSVEIHHAIPVRIMRAAEMQYHLPPRIAMPDVQLELPPERPLKTVVERLRSISPHIYIEGSMAGELTLRIEGDGASIRTFYNKLVPRFEDIKTSDNENDEPAQCTLKVDSKKMNACLHWQGTMALGRAVEKAVLCMVENEMLVVHCMLNPGIGFFTYYVPCHFLSPDQLDY